MILTSIAAAAVFATCEWRAPRGERPFMGSIPEAVNRYTDIPAPARARLKARMQRRDYDEVALITADGVIGEKRSGDGIAPNRYGGLREMHFAGGLICTEVTRRTWGPADQERGLVYCETEGGVDHCVIVPTVCRNVSRITRLAVPVGDSPAVPSEAPGGPATATPPPLTFEQLSDPDVKLPGLPMQPRETPPADGPWHPVESLVPRWLQGPEPVPVAVPPGSSAPVAPIPEPGTWALMALGLILLWAAARRRVR